MEITLFGPQEREETVELTGGPDELDIRSDEYALDDQVRVFCRIIRNGDLVRVTGEASTRLTGSCARCLEPFSREVRGSFSFLVKRMPMGVPIPPDASSEAGEEEDIIHVEHDVVKFDIGGYVHDAIILSLPMKIVCREDCKGLCVVCGGNLNEGECGCRPENSDPRWQGLGGLFENKK
jgi:uncharacterized protein